MSEYLFTVDKDNNPVEAQTRQEVIAKHLWRRTSGCIVVHEDKVLCQRRSETKDERPGVWVAMFGGKSLPDEDAKVTLLRELKEEIGVTFTDNNLSFYDLVKSEGRRQFEYLFIATWPDNVATIRPDYEEVAEVSWLEISVVLTALENDDKWYSYGYDKAMLLTVSPEI